MRPPSRIYHHVTRAKTTVVECLRDHFGVEPERAKALLALGAIYHDKRRVFDDLALEAGAYLRIHLQPKRFPVEGIAWKSLVVADERDFLVVRKPPGVPVHATLDNALDNVLHQLRSVTGRNLLVTQRLDVPVGGLLLFAKNPTFQTRFNRWLGERKVEKTYVALVDSAPPPGLHVHYMEPSERSPRRVVAEERPGWARCELSILRVEPLGARFEAEIALHTGRTHQVRTQLSALGSPLVGDRLYGSKSSFSGADIALFAMRLAFPRDSGGKWSFTVPPPWR